MNSMFEDNLFLLLIAIGAILVSIHVRGLYSTALANTGTTWLSEDIRLQNITGKRRFETGFLFYLSPIILIYLLLSFSPDLLSLSMGIVGSTATVGALPLSREQTFTLAPILAATAVTALIGIKPAYILEQYLRGVAHGIAGIPYCLQKIVQDIRQLNVHQIASDRSDFLEHLTLSTAHGELENDIKTIHVLNEWTFGGIGGQIWSDKALYILETSRPRLTREYQSFMDRLSRPIPIDEHSNTASSDQLNKDTYEIVLLARSLRLQYAELLALTIVNQDEPLPEFPKIPVLSKLVSTAQSNRAGQQLVGILFASSLTGFVISLSLATLFYLTVVAFSDQVAQNISLDAEGITLLIRGLPIAEYYESILFSAFYVAWWDTITVALIFVSGCTTALLYRASCMRRGDWEIWNKRRPVGQYVVVSFLATIVTTLLVEVLLFFKLVIWPSAHILNVAHFASMLKDFCSNFLEYGFFSLLAAPCAIVVCRLSDKIDPDNQHVKLSDLSAPRYITWFTLVGGLYVYLFVMIFIGGTQNWLNTAVGTVVPVFTLFVLSWRFWLLGSQSRYRTEVEINGQNNSDQYSSDEQHTQLKGVPKQTISTRETHANEADT